MSGRIAGARRRSDSPASDDGDAVPARSAPAQRPQHTGAQTAADSLESLAGRCETFFVILTFLGVVGAGILIALGVMEHFSIVPGIVLAVGMVVSLVPMLLICRWAQAYAVDLAMRAGGWL